MPSSEDFKQHDPRKWLGLVGMFTSHLIAFCVLYLTLTRFVPSLKLHYTNNRVTLTPVYNRIEHLSDLFVAYSLISLAIIAANALIIVLVSKYQPRWLSTYSHTVHSCLAVALLFSFAWMLNPLFSTNMPNGNPAIPAAITQSEQASESRD